MIVKLHKTPEGRIILAVCDSDLVGKCFEEDGLQLDLTSDFYKGREGDKKRVLELFKVAHIINLVGEKSVELGRKEGIVQKVIRIKGIPHAQAVIVRE